MHQNATTQIAVFPKPGPAASATLHGLGAGFALVVWDAGTQDPPRHAVPSVDGVDAPRPHVTLSVATLWGGRRTLCLLRWRGPASGPGIVRVRDGDGRLLAETAGAVDLPDFDPTSLLDGLDAPTRLRVVRFILDLCRSAQALRTDPDFVAACRRLVLELSPRPSPLRPRTALTPALLLCEGTLSSEFGEIQAALVMTDEAIGPAPFEPLSGSAPPRQDRVPLHLVIDATLCEDRALVVLVGRRGLACRVLEPRRAELPSLLERATGRDGLPGPLRRHVSRCLADRGARDPAAAAAVRELQVLVPLAKRQLADPARPVGASLDLAVPTGGGGLFLAGWIHDPQGLATGLRILTPFGEERRLGAFEHRLPRPDVAQLYGLSAGERTGFVAFLAGAPEAAPALQVQGELVLASGDRITLVPPPRPQAADEARNAVLGAVPPSRVTPALLEQVLAPAVSALHAAHMASRRAPEVILFGRQVDRPVVSVIVPLYRNLDFLRFQLSAFATDPAMAEAELIFVLDSPEQRDELEHYLHGLHGLYGLPMTLVVQGANCGYSAANNAGVAVARGAALLFLNSDVIPDRPGWLPELLAALEADPSTGAVGPKLLFDDDSLQHAGLLFAQDFRGRWYNHHYHKGMPRDFAPANQPRAVPGVTGACLLARRAAFEAAGGFCEDYVIGDYEDSDLCLRIRSAGHEIRYVPGVELYHLERQSISRHAGYTRGAASEYNGWLHAGRWSTLMEQLMSREWTPDAPAAAGLQPRRAS
ncbi:glycosyltransferase family 2 protein [Arenibaculum pallidiluteum]|uniref:glycosyltransferase family 2 protein n=1 Tax=Arenibaculum pallidiluteum TaxID=2812559 RepID=UPI001A973EEE|nr:glycosyltransferase family 2 protein [Arenibaculum pallidiluteum]